MNSNQPAIPNKREREDDPQAVPEDPAPKRVVSSPAAPQAFQAYQVIVSHPATAYGAGPFASARLEHRDDRPSFLSLLHSPITSSPQTPSESPYSTPHSSQAAVPESATILVRSTPSFQPIALPLHIPGDISVLATRTTARVCRFEKREGKLECTTPVHPVADTIYAFEETALIDSLQFGEAILSPTDFIDTMGLEDFIEFVQNKTSCCVVCQLCSKPSANHLKSCPEAPRLGTFIWSAYFFENNSTRLDQAVLVIASLLRLVAPSSLSRAADFLGMEVPDGYEDYKAWCLEPFNLFGLSVVNGYGLVEGLRLLVGDIDV